MAWLSFVIVVFVFYNPLWGELGSNLPRFPISFTVPVLWVHYTLPLGEQISTLAVTLAIWATIWAVLVGLELLGWLTFQRLRLREGFIFAVLPQEVNRLAEWMTEAILALTFSKYAWDFGVNILKTRLFDLAASGATGNFWKQGGLSQFLQGGPPGGNYLQQLAPIIPGLPVIGGQSQGAPANPSDLIPPPLFPWSVVILCVLTLVVAYAYRRERNFHYEQVMRQNQFQRKYRQQELRTPLPQA